LISTCYASLLKYLEANILSIIALVISGYTFWRTHLSKAKVTIECGAMTVWPLNQFELQLDMIFSNFGSKPASVKDLRLILQTDDQKITGKANIFMSAKVTDNYNSRILENFHPFHISGYTYNIFKSIGFVFHIDTFKHQTYSINLEALIDNKWQVMASGKAFIGGPPGLIIIDRPLNS